MLKDPCLSWHKGDAVKKPSVPQIYQCGSPVPCLENRQDGVQCTWVQSRVPAPEVGRDESLWEWTSTPFPSLVKLLPFRSILRLLGVICVEQQGEDKQGGTEAGEHAGVYWSGNLPLGASLTR